MIDITKLGKREKRRILSQNRGFMARVARALAVHGSAVSQVYWSLSKSARISQALNDELERLGVGNGSVGQATQ